MSKSGYLNKVVGYIPEYHLSKIRQRSKLRLISMARLVAIAVDNELARENPFEFNTDLPDDYIEYAFADEAARILTFIKTLHKGAGLDVLLLCRHEMNIPDKGAFLAAFRECLEKDMIEGFKPPERSDRAPNPEGYLYYRAKGTSPKENKQIRKKATEYERYLKMKKKFEKED